MKPPYYAVIFTSTLSYNTIDYSQMADKMETLAKLQPGFLGFDSAREKTGITVSYWSSLQAITNWKKNTDHILAQEKGIKDWYTYYNVKICLVEREYSFHNNNEDHS